MSTFGLLKQRRFGPFFLVQFLGALNDNLFKTIMLTMMTFTVASEAEGGKLTAIGGGLFILPFLLFSGIAGQLADKLDKARIMRAVKTAEILFMISGSLGFYLNSVPLLFATLFMMGTHSAFFGPVKYSILPQALPKEELMDGNALVEMGTFLAILIGELTAGPIARTHAATLICGTLLAVAAVGRIFAQFIPPAASAAPELKVNYNPFAEFGPLWRLTREKPAIFNSILGISWFWFFGATVLTVVPILAKHFLHGDETVVTLPLAAFSLSVGIGSVICAKVSHGDIELGIVPLGALGMSVFLADLFFVNYGAIVGENLSAVALLTGDARWTVYRVLADFGLIGIFGSLFIVPLYALIQQRANPDSRSRIIAANNIYNSVFMIASALLTMVLFKLGFNTLDVFLYTAILNIVVCSYIFLLIPEFVMRFVVWVLASTIYRLRYQGRDFVPSTGAAVLVANHVSFIDWFVVTAASRRPVRFVMDHNIFKHPIIGLFARAAKAIPIAPAKEDAAAKATAFARIKAELDDGELVCIFPEGKITYDGALNPFKPGVEQILATTPVPVIPIALTGLWGSFFSRKGGRAMSQMPKPARRTIGVAIGEPMPATTSAATLEARVRDLGDLAPAQARESKRA
jgi:1-acyl-sn-glycerol-3-phosphate acyltransferase